MKVLKSVDGFVGRGASFNPPSRFEDLRLEPLDVNIPEDESRRNNPTRFYADHSKSILAKNDSPDVGFTYSVNPYRGCEHGCIYCYARPTHEYLGFSAGLDFETKIMVKMDAPRLLAEAFRNPSWEPQVIALSGNTDCYQPVERKLQLTRRCLEVFLQFRNPVSIVTKNALVQRDIDILKELATLKLVSITLSITTLDHDLARKMEPRTASPWKRLQTVEFLASQGIPTGILIAPVIPGLNDMEIPVITRQAAERGATFAGRLMLRLPYSVKDLFANWLQQQYPHRAEKILNRIKDVREGKLSESRFGKRMWGEGEYAEVIERLFRSSCARYHLNETRIHLSTDRFRKPSHLQLEMF